MFIEELKITFQNFLKVHIYINIIKILKYTVQLYLLINVYIIIVDTQLIINMANCSYFSPMTLIPVLL